MWLLALLSLSSLFGLPSANLPADAAAPVWTAQLHQSTSDGLYRVPAALGQPFQPFDLVLDSRTGQTWIADTTCLPTTTPPPDPGCSPEECGTGADCIRKCGVWCCFDAFEQVYPRHQFASARLAVVEPHSRLAKNPVCDSPHKFDANSSITFTSTSKEFNVTSIDLTTVAGVLGMDLIQVANVTVTHFEFGRVSAFDDSGDVNTETMYDTTTIDGVFGIGFQGTSIKNQAPFLQAAYKNGILAAPVASVYLNGASGQLTLGSFDATNCNFNEVNWTPLTTTKAYTFKAKITYGSNYSASGLSAVVSTSEPYLSFSSELIAQMVADCGSDYIDYNNKLSCPAPVNQLKPLTITLNGRDYVIPPELMFGKAAEGECFLRAWDMTTASLPYYDLTLGLPFLQSVCSFYDQKQQRFGVAPHMAH